MVKYGLGFTLISYVVLVLVRGKTGQAADTMAALQAFIEGFAALGKQTIVAILMLVFVTYLIFES